MGWRASTIIIKDSRVSPAILAQENDVEAANRIAKLLGCKDTKNFRQDTVEEEMNRIGSSEKDDTLFVGCFGGITVIHSHDVYRLFDQPGDSGLEFLYEHFFGCEILAFVLHSVVNLWGYSYFDGEKIVRSVAGSNDDGVFLNCGTPLPEESQISTIGDESYQLDIHDDSCGEQIVFLVCERLLGVQFDHVDNKLLGLSGCVFDK